LWSRFKGKIDKYGAGGAGITQEDRQALVDMALEIRDSYEQSYNETIDDYSALAKEVGVSEKLIGIPFRKGSKGTNKPSPSGKTVTRTGIDRKTGKKVIQYSDGSVEYGN
jgi:homospermidine synthase